MNAPVFTVFNWLTVNGIGFFPRLKAQSLRVIERVILGVLFQLGTIRCLTVSDNFLHSSCSSSLGNGMKLVCQPILSCLYHLVSAPSAKKTQCFWLVAEQRKILFLLALARIKTEATVRVYWILELACLGFCTRVKLDCLKLYCFWTILMSG